MKFLLFKVFFNRMDAVAELLFNGRGNYSGIVRIDQGLAAAAVAFTGFFVLIQCFSGSWSHRTIYRC